MKRLSFLLLLVCAVCEKYNHTGNLSGVGMPLKHPTTIPESNFGDKGTRFENITTISGRISGLQFLDVPKGDEIRIHNLKLEENYLLFEVFSNLMAHLQPTEYPTDLVRDALKKRLPIAAFQLLKSEFATLGWMIFWAVLAISVPFITLVYLCCSKSNLHRLKENTSETSVDFRDKCVERTLTALLLFFLILETIPIIVLFLANEQISRQIMHSNASINLFFDDLDTFTRNTHMQMSFVATSSTDIALEALRKDLEDVEELLGRPFQEDLARETGADFALDNLEELSLSSDKVTSSVTELLSSCERADKEAELLQNQLKEVARQLSIVRQQCRSKDRALCYTIQYTGLEVVFSCTNINEDLNLKHLERMHKEKNLIKRIDKARTEFRGIPSRVAQDTASHVSELKAILGRKRTQIYQSAHTLDTNSRSVSKSIKTIQTSTSKQIQAVNRWELWRWLSVLGVGTAVCLVWGLLICGTPCGCGTTARTKSLLLSGVIVTALLVGAVAGLGILFFLVGMHGQSLLCKPLYQDFATLEIFLEHVNCTLNIEQVLRKCEMDQPAYSTFNMSRFFDVKLTTNYKSWSDFKKASAFRIDRDLEILSSSLQMDLQFLSSLSDVKLDLYRAQISKPVTKKDLISFSEQLTTVSRQSSDPSTSRRFDELATKVRKIISKELSKLNALKETILYKITALDFLIHPLGQEANRSLAHLRDVQYFIEQNSKETAQKSVSRFIERLERHLEKLESHVTTRLSKEIGRCRPIWDIFHALRFTLCKLIVDPTNAISASSFALTLLFLGVAVVVFNLLEHYTSIRNGTLEASSSITHRRARDGLIIDDEGTWATPSSENNNGESNGLWGQSRDPLIPPAPRIPENMQSRSPNRLATIALRISGNRVSDIPSVSRARSPKKGRLESMKLIEPICWKSGSLTPKSWL